MQTRCPLEDDAVNPKEPLDGFDVKLDVAPVVVKEFVVIIFNGGLPEDALAVIGTTLDWLFVIEAVFDIEVLAWPGVVDFKNVVVLWIMVLLLVSLLVEELVFAVSILVGTFGKVILDLANVLVV